MSDEQGRGAAIKRRRLALGIKSVREFAAQSGVSREAITAVESGASSASEQTYARLEAWLDGFEEETGHDDSDELVEYRLSGDFGVSIVVKGPIGNMAELEGSAARLLREMRGDRD